MILHVAEELGAAEPPILEIGFQPRAFDDRIRTYDVFIGLWPEGDMSIAQEWDLAASDLIVNEAGGRFTSLDGADGPWGGNAVATNGLLHDEVLGRLG